MIRGVNSLNKSKKQTEFKFIIKFFIFLMILFSFIFSFNIIHIVSGSIPYYTPAPPFGNTTGDKNVDYEYVVYTSEVGSCWMFDWGDGNYSNWIKVGDSDSCIIQSHRWNSYGVYNVKVKLRSIYMVESVWSDPLAVNISPPADSDGDGWSDSEEVQYGTNLNDSGSHPTDSDGDHIPDSFDVDNDNDGLTDVIENSLGSNPKESSDITIISVKNSTYYLVDTNDDRSSDILYNLQKNSKTKIQIEDGKLVLDVNGDGSFDYTYNNGILARYNSPFPWLLVIVVTVFIIVIILFILFKKGVIYLYQEEYVVEK